MKQILDFFNDKLFLTFTMFILLFYIIFYQFINNSIKMKIFNMISNPIVLVVLIVFIGVILYHNFTVGMIILFSVLVSISYKSEKEEEIVNTNEGFKDSFVTEQMKNVLNTLSDGIEENKNIEEKFKNTLKKEKSKPKKETFQQIKKREFNLSKQEDKHLLYTKETLKEIINRINYEYEDIEYLKKYIGNKFEEIIDLLDLLKDD
jgi:hypothetical protein